jgi:hydroxyethylthiazole kinase-like uncharacterized protein yjeF
LAHASCTVGVAHACGHHGSQHPEEAVLSGFELLTVEEMGRADQGAVAAGVPSLALMEAAGRAVADAVSEILGRTLSASVAVACGPGNNGGDGFVAARVLAERGAKVRLGLLGERGALRGDAAEAATRWTGAVEALTTDTLVGTEVIVDAIFGAGLSRPVDAQAAAVVSAINGSGKPIVAVDVPSGLDGSSGCVVGEVVVQATHTVTFFRLKPGHLLLPGRLLCGEVSVADIGIPSGVLEAIAPQTFANCPALWAAHYPWPSLAGHKYARGHAVAVSGPPDMTGAARLAARGALRAGAGLVTLVGSAAATAINATHATAVMVRATPTEAALADFLADVRRNAVVIGPGAGADVATSASVLTVLKSGAAAVLDADALTAFSLRETNAPVKAAGMGFIVRGEPEQPAEADLFAAIKARRSPVVLTPHDGEFQRLFGPLDGSKLERARHAARASGAIVVLKGPDTVIAAPDGRAAINDNAPPWLATAGAGDVLAGFIAGLLAQKMPAFEAACAAVWLHGACASTFGLGLIAEDLPEVLPRVLTALRNP